MTIIKGRIESKHYCPVEMRNRSADYTSITPADLCFPHSHIDSQNNTPHHTIYMISSIRRLIVPTNLNVSAKPATAESGYAV